jgi:hypothetical protein
MARASAPLGKRIFGVTSRHGAQARDDRGGCDRTQEALMAKQGLIEKALAAVRVANLDDVELLRELLGPVRPGCGLVAEAIAKRAIEHPQPKIAGDLAAAFAPLLEDPQKRDPQARGKIAIARALYELDHWDDNVFTVGLTVKQLEGWGDALDDVAAELRAVCGIAHAKFFRGDALDVLVKLLTDEEPVAREGAARGIGDLGRPDGGAVLRYLVLVGETHPGVLASAFESLLLLAREASSKFLVELLEDHDDRAEAAALALGSARIASALEPLIAWANGCRPDQRARAGYLALALLRTDAANAELVEAIRTRRGPDAIAAARALATFKHDPAIASALEGAARDVKDAATQRAIRELLD